MPSQPTAVADLLQSAADLLASGSPREAIERLTDANRTVRSAAIEQRLVSIRHAAFDGLRDEPRSSLPAPVVAVPPRSTVLPETEPESLTTETLRDGLAQYGCVLVRGLIPPERAAWLAGGIDNALDAFDTATEGSKSYDDQWYTPFKPQEGRYRVGGRRQWVRASGAVWTADVPRMLFELLEVVDQTGIGDLVTDYLGERPALSANKCTLRRVPVTTNAGWHQDGAFLGEEVRSLNLWLSLANCGVDAPGLDVVPRRLDHVVETGTDGAYFDWAVGDDVVQRVAGDAGVVRPRFGPGDALLFDHLFLHRTAVSPTMTKERHAMETWFFAPSSYPDGQIPLAY